MEIMVAITVDATGVSYLTYLPWLLLCSLIVLFIDLLWGYMAFRKHGYQPAIESEQLFHPKQVAVQIMKLFFALSIFLALVVSIGNVTGLDFILTVTLVILPFAIVWSFLMKRWKTFKVIGWVTWKERTNGMQNFVVLFLSLAFFQAA
ncbi:hypothetical protein [Thalassobacillus sp. C254]|uniref:hypothetical protein n=1 Tax=Thalassobacillus sp. C254 TaxID=1225341 RepID=UPI000ABA51BE|nr:hypothetical protein [Thalassobacillus sp. C254]